MMNSKKDKNVIKHYFRSGSRPTQQQFHELIDNCYNEALSSFVSGYDLLIDSGKNNAVKSVRRVAGTTVLIPFFDRINTKDPQVRVYHYAIPVCNIGSGLILKEIKLNIELPQNAQYSIRDQSKDVQITSEIQFDHINLFNGVEKIFSLTEIKEAGPKFEFQINEPADLWIGIGIDIGIKYTITSHIAVSDQLDITSGKEQMLEHRFGSAGCVFIQNE